MSEQNTPENNEQQQAPQQQPYPPQPQQPQQPQQGQFAPSAYSAPQPGYGYYGGQQQVQAGPGFGTMFSPNFAQKGGRALAKIVMLLTIIAFGIFAAYQLFDLIDTLTIDGLPGMRIVTALVHFLYAIAKGLVVLGLIRLVLERVPEEDNSDN